MRRAPKRPMGDTTIKGSRKATEDRTKGGGVARVQRQGEQKRNKSEKKRRTKGAIKTRQEKKEKKKKGGKTLKVERRRPRDGGSLSPTPSLSGRIVAHHTLRHAPVTTVFLRRK